MNGPDRAGYRVSKKVEIATQTKLKAWELAPLTSDIKILDLTWAFKFKRYAGVSIGKFKARFCCTEDQQVRCIEYLDTFAPVI